MKTTMRTVLASLLGLGVISGPASAQRLLRTLEAVWGGRSAAEFEPAGDLDGDGHADLITREQSWNGGGVANAGRARILSGVSGEAIRTLEGSGHFEQMGKTVLSLPDASGDGFPDYAVSSSLEGVVYSGKDHRELLQTSSFTEAARAGDLNGDGVEDFLLTRSYWDGGEVHAFYGRTFEPAFSVFSDRREFGDSVVSFGDVDGDGVPDFAVGAPNRAPNGLGDLIGHVEVFSGADGRLLYGIPGLDYEDWFGDDVLAPGDVSGDGIPDLVVRSGCCGLHFHDGPTGAPLGTVGPWAGSPMVLGDVNGNGFADIVYLSDIWAGTYALKLADGGARKVIYSFVSDYEIRTHFGKDMAAAGDVDGDEVPDFLVAVSNTLPEWGRIELFSGIPRGQRIFGEGCPVPAPAMPGSHRRAGAEPGADLSHEAVPPHPRIGADPPGPGHEGVARIHLSRVAPGLEAFLLLGLRSAETSPQSFLGCPVYVLPGSVHRVTTRVIRPGEGAASFEVPLPLELTGQLLYAQWFVRHPQPEAGPALWSSSRAIELRIPGWSRGGPEEAR